MKKIILLFSLFLIMLFSNNYYALENQQIVIDVSQLEDDYLSSQIHSMYINCLDTNKLYINGIFVSESEDLNFKFEYEDIVCEMSLKDDICNLKYHYNTVLKKHLFIELSTLNSIHTLTIYPNMYVTNSIQLQGERKDNLVIFDDVNINGKDFHFYIDLDQDLLFVNDKSVEVATGNEVQSVFFETYVDFDYVNPIYLDYLPKRKYPYVKEVMYTDEEIEKASVNEILTLTNSKSLYDIQAAFHKYMYYWSRVGKEDYIVGYDERIQNIFLYQEGIDANIGIKERLYAIFSNDIYYDSYRIKEKQEETILKTNLSNYSNWMTYADFVSATKDIPNIDVDKAILYRHNQYTGWSDYYYSNKEVKNDELTKVEEQYRYKIGKLSDWSSYAYTAAEASEIVKQGGKSKSKTVYAKSVGTWSEYSDYTYENKVVACRNDEDCRYKEKATYAKQYGTWSEYTDFIYNESDSVVRSCYFNNDCRSKIERRYALVKAQLTNEYSSWLESVSFSNNYQIQIYYKYECSGITGSSVAYSTEEYAVGKRGACPLLQTIDSVKRGYRKAYVEYQLPDNSEYTLEKCSDSSGYSKCFSKDKVALSIREYSEPTDYIYTSCTDTSTRDDLETVVCCLAKREFSYSYRTWSNYSDYIYSTNEASENVRTKSKDLYAVRIMNYSNYSNWSNIKQQVSGDDVIYETRWAYQTREELKPIYTSEKSDVLERCYRYRTYTPKRGIGTVSYVEPVRERLEDFLRVNDDDIIKMNMQIDDKIAVNKYLAGKNNVKLDDIKMIVGENNWLLNQDVFASYLYNKHHWYALIRNINVDTLSASYDEYSSTIIKNEGSDVLDYRYIVVDTNNKIVFFDEKDPFINYPKTPSNFSQNDIDKIKNADYTKPMYCFYLSKKDILEIRKWALNNYSKIGKGLLLERYLMYE